LRAAGWDLGVQGVSFRLGMRVAGCGSGPQQEPPMAKRGGQAPKGISPPWRCLRCGASV
jgi:hypothetical protein